jgi:hypothetical protein
MKAIFYIAILVLIIPGKIFAFDDDFSLNEPDFKKENLLDIKAYQFRKSLQQQWYETENGWRATGGSLDSKRLFLQTEIRLKQTLSNALDVRLSMEQEEFYAIKPFPHPLIELASHPWSIPFEISFLGTAAFDKRQADLGVAFGLGKRPRDYLRFAWLEQDYYYNTKNVFDASRYIDKPKTAILEGAHKLFQDKLRVRFVLKHFLPLKFVFNDQVRTFEHEGDDYKLMLDYQYRNNALYGLTYRGFNIDKALDEMSRSRKQTLSFTVMDFYWHSTRINTYEIDLGAEWDKFGNQFRVLTNQSDSYDYYLRTWQLYGILHHDYAPHKGWEYGLYIGRVKETKNFLISTNRDKKEFDVETKLRTSWEYHSKDKKNTLMFHFTVNVDNILIDPGDGAGMTYQAIF